MIAPTPVLDVEATAKREGATLRLQLLVANRHAHDVFFFHRFWTMAKGGAATAGGGAAQQAAKAAGDGGNKGSGPPRMAWDPRGPSRYELAGILRIVVGPALVPPNKDVSNRYIPFAARIAPGASMETEMWFEVPIVEHALFDPPGPEPKYEDVEVRRIALAVYGTHDSEKNRDRVRAEPCPLDPAFFWVRAPDALMVPTYADVPVEPLQVRRRKDPIARFLLPGEVA